MLMYNLKEYSDNYSKSSGVFWKFCRAVPAVSDDGTINRSNRQQWYNKNLK